MYNNPATADPARYLSIWERFVYLMGSKTHKMNGFPSNIGTFWNAIRRPIRSFNPTSDIKGFDINISDFSIDPVHFSSFATVFQNNLVENKQLDLVPSIYPMSFVYPVMLRAVSLSTISIPMMLSMVSIKSKIQCFKKIRPDWTFSIKAAFQRVIPALKGMELDFNLCLKADDEKIWENTNTLFFKGIKSGAPSDEGGFTLKPIENISNQSQFMLSRKQGKQFCRIMGDSNAIHTNHFFAILMGYKRAFCQPYLALGRLLTNKDWLSMVSGPGRFQLEFKGPLFYDEWITVKQQNEDNKIRFDLYSGESSRPGILGSFEHSG